jgi:pilus assembly protein Flp/PilA
MRRRLATWWSARDCERGATAVEYALMAGLIALVIVAGVTALGKLVDGQFTAGAGLFK